MSTVREDMVAMIQEAMQDIRRAMDFSKSRARLVASLLSFPFIEADGWRGLLWRRVDGLRIADKSTCTHPLPFGWVSEREWDRDAVVIGPAWFMLPRRVWQRRWRLLIPLIRLGFLQGTPGDYIYAHRFSWRWWESRYAAMYPRWAAFGKRLYDDWCARMPEWSA